MIARHHLIAGLLGIAVSMVAAAAADAQGLADVALREEARRMTLASKPAKVYTNDNLNPDFTKVAEPAVAEKEKSASSGQTQAAAADEAAARTAADPGIPKYEVDDKKEKFWRDKANSIRTAMDNARKQIDALQARVSGLAGDPAEQKVTSQLLAASRAELASLQEESVRFGTLAKVANVPDAWIR
jgi:hypothetical protein